MKKHIIKKYFSITAAILIMTTVFVQTSCGKKNNQKDIMRESLTNTSVVQSIEPENNETISPSAIKSDSQAQKGTCSSIAGATAPKTAIATFQNTEKNTQTPCKNTALIANTSSPQKTVKPSISASAVATKKVTATVAASPTAAPTQVNSQSEKKESAQEIISEMTIEEKVAQLFIVVPYALTDISNANAANSTYKSVYDKYPVGGFCYMENSIESETQVKTMLKKAQQYSNDRVGVPLFTCIDEEGGKVARLANSDKVSVPDVRYMSEIGKSRNVEEAKTAGRTIGKYLKNYGFNVDFAPVADVLSNPDNVDVNKRSFGSDKDVVSDMTLAVMDGLGEYGIYTTLKHFPGNGSSAGDTHLGFQYTNKTLDELKKCELVPFVNGIANGTEFIMVGHISLPNVIGDNTPASLSKKIITDLLREELGYSGIVITDALNMGAITKYYGSEDAVIKAFLAGADMLLMPDDFHSAYDAVLAAVRNGTISEQRLNESLIRIFEYKLNLAVK